MVLQYLIKLKFILLHYKYNYVHPSDEGTYVRIMPGKSHSNNSCQQRPYVNHRINGQSVDKFGKKVLNNSPETHIPIDEFVYRDKI